MSTTTTTIESALADYGIALRDEHLGERRTEEARRQLEALVTDERRSWSQAVAQIARGRRPQWNHLSAKASLLVDHSTRPLSASIHVEVEGTYHDGRRRGSFRLYGAWEERDQVLAELARLIGS